MSQQDGGPAFPAYGDQASGLSLRDYFATAALQAIVSRDSVGVRPHGDGAIALLAYAYADQMLAARKTP